MEGRYYHYDNDLNVTIYLDFRFLDLSINCPIKKAMLSGVQLATNMRNRSLGGGGGCREAAGGSNGRVGPPYHGLL